MIYVLYTSRTFARLDLRVILHLSLPALLHLKQDALACPILSLPSILSTSIAASQD